MMKKAMVQNVFNDDDIQMNQYAEEARIQEMNRFGFQELEKTCEYVETQWYTKEGNVY